MERSLKRAERIMQHDRKEIANVYKNILSQIGYDQDISTTLLPTMTVKWWNERRSLCTRECRIQDLQPNDTLTTAAYYIRKKYVNNSSTKLYVAVHVIQLPKNHAILFLRSITRYTHKD